MLSWRPLICHVKGKSFSICYGKNFQSTVVIPAVTAAHKYLWASALPARSPLLLVHVSFARTKLILSLFPWQHRAHGQWSECHRARRRQGLGGGQMLPPWVSHRSEVGIERGRFKDVKPWVSCERHLAAPSRARGVCPCLRGAQLCGTSREKWNEGRALARRCTALHFTAWAALRQRDPSSWVLV